MTDMRSLLVNQLQTVQTDIQTLKSDVYKKHHRKGVSILDKLQGTPWEGKSTERGTKVKVTVNGFQNNPYLMELAINF